MTQDLAALVAKLRDEYMLVTRNEAADALEAQAAEIARLKTEIERLGRDLNRAKYGEPDFSWAIHNAAMVELRDRAEKAEAALSESQALLAMWPEVAATEVEAWGMPSGSAPAAIRTLTPADAQAALDARINAAREEGWVMGLREAADTVEDYCSDMPDLAGHGHSVGLKDAILAKIKEADHG